MRQFSTCYLAMTKGGLDWSWDIIEWTVCLSIMQPQVYIYIYR